jgi:hypothetical protein
MKKYLFALLALHLIVSTTFPAYAVENILETTVVIEGFTEITYPTKVIIGSSGCKTVKFKYVNDENLAQENSVFLVQILHKTKKITQGFGAWFSTLTSNSNSVELGPLPRAGVIPIKLCKKKWTSGTGVNKTVMAATPPGSYRIYFTAGYVDPVTGKPLEGKIEIFRTLKVS